MSSAESNSNEQAHGQKTDIAGDVLGPVLSGLFKESVVLLVNQIIQQSEKLPVPRQISPPPSDFTDRDEELKVLLSNIERGKNIVVLRGMCGVGKTDIGRALAERIKARFTDGQIFVDLQGTNQLPMKPADAMIHVIHAFYLPTFPLPEDQQELNGLYKSILAEKKILLFLDNVASSKQVEPLFPTPPGCMMLITSRWTFDFPGMVAIDLDVLPPADACNLLLANAERIGDKVEELASLCGYLPIALRNAGSTLAVRRDLDVSEYIHKLRDTKKRMELIDASFKLSYDLLPLDRRELWCMLSIFPADFDRDGAAAVWMKDAGSSAEALSDLLNWNLISFTPSDDIDVLGRYRLHDLARVFADTQLDTSARETAQKCHANHYKNLLSEANSLYEAGGKSILAGLKLFDKEWKNIQAGQNWADVLSRGATGMSASDETKKAALRLCTDYPTAGYLLLSLRQHPQESIYWLETGVIAARLLKDRKAEAYHLGNLGNIYDNLGEFRKAIECYEQTLVFARHIGDRWTEEASLGNIGMAYYNLGEFSKAIEYQEQSLLVIREIGDRRGEGATLGNLGTIYSTLGEYRKAIEYHEKSLLINREIGNQRDEGRILGNLGVAHKNLGEFSKAKDYNEQALVIAHGIGDRRGEGNAAGNLGSVYYNLGETSKALDYYGQWLKTAQEIGDRLSEGKAQWGQAICLEKMNDLDLAISKAEQALNIFELIESPCASAMHELLSKLRRKQLC